MAHINPIESASRHFSLSSLPIMVNDQQNDSFVSLHKHEFDEIVLVTSGSGIHHTRFGTEKISAGTVLIIPEGEQHAYSEAQTLSLLNLMIRFRNLPLPWGELHQHPAIAAFFFGNSDDYEAAGSFLKIKLAGQDFQRAIEILTRCRTEVWERKAGWSLSCFGGVLEYLTLLIRNYNAQEIKVSDVELKIRECIGYINDHPEQTIHILKLCKKTGLSDSTLLRHFKRMTGMAPLEYQLTMRLTRAANMLISCTSMPISQAALRTGFGDSNYFTKLFRSRIGCSPREYRKLNALTSSEASFEI